MALADIRHWQIGDVRVSRIVEVGQFADNIQMLYTDADADWLRQFTWLAPRFVTPEGQMVISFQAFVVQTPTRRIMVDTCIGNDRQRRFGVFTNLQTSFLADIAAAGCPADSIDTVLCTHLHFDHTGWNTQRVNGKWVPTFPKARYLFGKKEWDAVREMRTVGDGHMEHFDDCIAPIVDAGLAEFVGTDHRVCDEIWLEPTHGHTAGHCSVRIRSRDEEAVITGDLMHHPCQCTVPDKLANFDDDKAMAARTRREFLGRVDNRRMLVIGSHFAEPTAGWVEKAGDSWKFFAKED
ncbi:MAG TPA: MBL fold metallo-hydrolase [Steroidobacteraceae bacterium]|jgi:glyoxylase-like metal-dependent hydrolase (beta-lactamase superfamily II)